jgi:hypothetical protein
MPFKYTLHAGMAGVMFAAMDATVPVFAQPGTSTRAKFETLRVKRALSLRAAGMTCGWPMEAMSTIALQKRG